MDRASAEIGATREVIARETFDALLDMLIAAKVVSSERVAFMGECLARRLERLADGEDETEFASLREPMLREEAARLRARSVLIRARHAAAEAGASHG